MICEKVNEPASVLRGEVGIFFSDEPPPLLAEVTVVIVLVGTNSDG